MNKLLQIGGQTCRTRGGGRQKKLAKARPRNFIADDFIEHVWLDQNGAEAARVQPDFYAGTGGLPVDSVTGEKLRYSHSESRLVGEMDATLDLCLYALCNKKGRGRTNKAQVAIDCAKHALHLLRQG